MLATDVDELYSCYQTSIVCTNAFRCVQLWASLWSLFLHWHHARHVSKTLITMQQQQQHSSSEKSSRSSSSSSSSIVTTAGRLTPCTCRAVCTHVSNHSGNNRGSSMSKHSTSNYACPNAEMQDSIAMRWSEVCVILPLLAVCFWRCCAGLQA
jgi:hypothetical protein